jgi:hypothetical protein
VKTVAELGDDLVLAPERHVALALAGDGVPLGELVVERRERATREELARAIVLDTTHAKDGVLDLRGALRGGAGDKSAKKVARTGDVIVSRLRPYLRQIAFVHPKALALAPGRPRALAVSPEFYVLTAESDLAFLLPFLLGADTQRTLAAAQEGGHHPRVPVASLFALRVPHALLRARARTSSDVDARLAELYAAQQRVAEVLGG